jgi:hypothetical protein
MTFALAEQLDAQRELNLHGDAALSLALNSYGSIADDATPCGKAVPSVALPLRLVNSFRNRPPRSARCLVLDSRMPNV